MPIQTNKSSSANHFHSNHRILLRNVRRLILQCKARSFVCQPVASSNIRLILRRSSSVNGSAHLQMPCQATWLPLQSIFRSCCGRGSLQQHQRLNSLYKQINIHINILTINQHHLNNRSFVHNHGSQMVVNGSDRQFMRLTDGMRLAICTTAANRLFAAHKLNISSIYITTIIGRKLLFVIAKLTNRSN